MIMKQADGETLFLIRTNAYYLFFCGLHRNGIQTLMASNRGELILYQFDEKGRPIGKQTRLRPAERMMIKVSYEFHRLLVEVPEEFVRWQEEIVFKHHVI